MIEVPRSGKIRRTVSQEETSLAVSEVSTLPHSIGFATFGEQYNGIHINQTFTGVAIGSMG